MADSFFNYGYLNKDKVLRDVLNYLICHSLFREQENLHCSSDCKDDIYSDFILLKGDSELFNTLPIKCRLYLITVFIRGLLGKGVIQKGLDHSLYIAVEHIFGEIKGYVIMELEDPVPDQNGIFYSDGRTCLRICLQIMLNDSSPPEKSILELNKKWVNPKESKKKRLDLIAEGYEEDVDYLQGALFGGFFDSEFSESEGNRQGFIDEQERLFKLCEAYDLMELINQLYDLVYKYANVEFDELKQNLLK